MKNFIISRQDNIWVVFGIVTIIVAIIKCSFVNSRDLIAEYKLNCPFAAQEVKLYYRVQPEIAFSSAI